MLDGKVIDFTAEAADRACKREGIPRPPLDDMDYFGVHIPTAFIIESIAKTEAWSPLLGEYFESEGVEGMRYFVGD